jgi:thiol:disulfide interchange protein
MRTRSRLVHLLLISGLLFGVSFVPAVAQEPAANPGNPAGQAPPLDAMDSFGEFGGLGGFLDEGGGDELTLSGQLKLKKGTREGVLEIRADLAPDWHVYALDQKGGPGPAKIAINSPEKIELTGPFRADREPEVREVEYFEVPLREHYGQVVWTAPVRLAEGVDPENVQLEVEFQGQICSDEVGCKPMFGEPIPITFGGYLDGESAEPAPAGTESPAAQPPQEASAGAEMSAAREPSDPAYRAARSFATIDGAVRPATVAPGGQVQLALTAQCDPGWHIYAYAPQDPQEIAKPALIVVTEPANWSVGDVQVSSEPTIKQPEADEPPVAYHSGTVTWTVQIGVPEDVPAGQYELAGLIGYQTCTDASCDRPRAARFTTTVTVGDAVSDQRTALQFTEASYSQAAQLAAAGAELQAPPAVAVGSPGAPAAGAGGEQPVDAATDIVAAEPVPATELQPAAGSATEVNLAMALAYAFLGGLILNIMPCVLPVIGLKVMAFVQQSGEDRGKVFALNVWYSLGLISVFWALATVAAIWNVGWGQQFGNEMFAITMAAVVFAMGLSFLGVWEIPIPGFVGSGKADQLAQKEGPAGAFFKGAITTVLATPCSGPGIAIALGYCTGKPIGFVYLIFTMLGLGMASPYLIIGANPSLIRFLPKPGMWMETFKQIMGFVLMATVIYLLSFIDWVNLLPTLTLLVGLAAGLWWIGRTSIAAEFQVKLRAWAGGLALAGLVGLYAFGGRATIGGYEVAGLQTVMQHRLDRFLMLQASKSGDIDQLLASAEVTQHVDQIQWVPFSEQRLNRLIEQNRTVMVDFTADWCLTCKALEATVLNTQEVRDSLRKNGVVTLLADWTDGDPEISRMLETLADSKQVPVLAIFPAGRPEDRIVLLGGYTKATVLQKLEQAGPSQVAERTGAEALTRLAEREQ